MRAYVAITGALFALITVAHLLRIVYAEPRLARDPGYLLLTAVAAGLAIWAARLVWRGSRF